MQVGISPATARSRPSGQIVKARTLSQREVMSVPKKVDRQLDRPQLIGTIAHHNSARAPRYRRSLSDPAVAADVRLRAHRPVQRENGRLAISSDQLSTYA
jgi:hypothetical protein